MAEPEAANENARRRLTPKLIPLAVLVAGLAVFFAGGFDRYVSFEALCQERETLLDWTAANPILAPLAFTAFYALMTAFSLPVGTVVTLFGGLLFGTLAGTVYTVIGATVGATALFLAARAGLGDPLRARAGPALRRMEAGFRRNALNYLLVLRLIPVFPFWLVNLVPAFLGVPLQTYVLGTFLGIIPGTLIIASIGAGLGSVLAECRAPDLDIVLRPDILLPLIGLAVLAVLPILYRRRTRPRG